MMTMNGNLLIAWASLFVTMVFAGNARAVVISWNSPVQISTVGDSIIETQGGLVTAINIKWENTGGIVSVNGVPFTNAQTLDDILANATSTDPDVYQDGNVGSAFETMLDSFGDAGGVVGVRNITLTGLTPGDSYLVQFFTSDLRSALDDAYVQFESDGVPLSPRITLRVGYSLTGTFVADGPTQGIGISAYTAALGGSQTALTVVNGFQLRDLSAVPEPSTVLLFGVGGLTTLAACRRRKREAARARNTTCPAQAGSLRDA